MFIRKIRANTINKFSYEMADKRLLMQNNDNKDDNEQVWPLKDMWDGLLDYLYNNTNSGGDTLATPKQPEGIRPSETPSERNEQPSEVTHDSKRSGITRKF